MIVSQQKRAENIAEYILYMWQIEDLIRAYEFNLKQIKHNLIDQYQVDPSLHNDIQHWYEGLIDSMKSEEITLSGHLAFLNGLVEDMNDIHFRLIESPHHSDYQVLYEEAIVNINDFRKKMATKEKISDMEVCLTVLYGFMLMKMKKRQISEDTSLAIDTIRNLVALFSQKYKEFEEGTIDI
ncbi:MAG: DUF4924 family protein [Bacteroidales bacterium]|nr:DUF4924 family protein [Bacteroidales bacterium]